MTFLKTWLLGLIAAAMVVTLADALLPEGRQRSVLRSCGGVILFLAIVQPLCSWGGIDFRWRQGDVDAMAETQISQYEEEHLTAMETIIKEKCGAYISKTAAELGLTCCAQVECQTADGIPLPCEAVLNIPFDTALSRRIESELGIDAAHQHWQEG